jgi:hypothetical protein
MGRESSEQVGLKDSASYLLDECRMVLPGIQALFGFQLIAVFNSRFADDLSDAEQKLHFIAIALIAVAIAIIMTPASLHRTLSVREVTERFLLISERLLLASMFPLAVAICLDFYLIARLILGAGPAPAVAVALLLLFAFCWVILPRSKALQRLIAR